MEVSMLKKRFFPLFYQTFAERMIDFFGVYMEFLEKQDNPAWKIDNILSLTNIDTTIDEYLKYLKYELMYDYPEDIVADLRYTMKHLALFYQSKGTEKSVKYFFRAVYDSFARIDYPKENILKASDGRWRQPLMIEVDITPEKMPMYLGCFFTCDDGATGEISSRQKYVFEGEDEMTWVYDVINTDGTIKPGEAVFTGADGDCILFHIKRVEYSAGEWTSNKGFLSEETIVLQDSYYYQEFSYVITSLLNVSDYDKVYGKLLNPAGLGFFGNVQFRDDESLDIDRTPSDPDEQDKILGTEGGAVSGPLGMYGDFIDILMREFELIVTLHEDYPQTNIIFLPECHYRQYTSQDQVLATKQFRNTVDDLRENTPFMYDLHTNDCSKMIFDNESGLYITGDWIQMQVDSHDYTIVSNISKYPKELKKLVNGCFEIPLPCEIKEFQKQNIFMFHNGEKIHNKEFWITYEDETREVVVAPWLHKKVAVFHFKNPEKYKDTITFLCFDYKKYDESYWFSVPAIKNYRLATGLDMKNYVGILFVNGKYSFDWTYKETLFIYTGDKTGDLEVYICPKSVTSLNKYKTIQNPVLLCKDTITSMSHPVYL